MKTTRMQQSRPHASACRRRLTPAPAPTLVRALAPAFRSATLALLAAAAIAGCSSDRTANSESNSAARAEASADSPLAPAALIDFRVLEAPPTTDRSFASPVILTNPETSALFERPDSKVLMAPRIKLLENFTGSVRVGTESGDNAMLDGISLRARVLTVAEDAITLELSGAENRAGRRTAQLDTVTVSIPVGAAAAVTMPDPLQHRPRFLVVSAQPDTAPWPATIAHAGTNIMIHYGVSEVPADASLPAIDIPAGRPVAVDGAAANRFMSRLAGVPGYRFVSAPAVFTKPGEAATVSQLDTDKAGLQTDGREITATAVTGSDKSLILDIRARRIIAGAWQPLFAADDLAVRADQSVLYIEPARDGAAYRTILLVQPSAYPAGAGPRQTAASVERAPRPHQESSR